MWVMLGVDLDKIYSIDPSYSKGIHMHTMVITYLGTKSSGIGLSHGMEHYNLGMAD